MRIPPVSIAFLGMLVPLAGQENPLKWDVEIPGPISDGRPGEPGPPPVVPDFSVIQSQTRHLDVVEAPPMLGLPPVAGTISITTRKVENPELPALPPPLPPLSPDDPAVIARMEEMREKYRGTELIFLSVCVYDYSRSFLQIYPNGRIDQVISAWSNLDFNHFSGGWASYRVKLGDGTSEDRMLLMGIGNMEMVKMHRFAAKSGTEYEAPDIPKMADYAVTGPAFVVVEGDSDSPAMDTLEQLHDLYRKEGPRMKAAHVARVAEEARQRAWFLANPPKPKNLVLHYWRGDRPQNEGGGR